jgi:hypothetical protein
MDWGVVDESVEFLTREQVHQLAEMAEQARLALSRFAGYEVAYDQTGLQLLDEWIDRHMRQFPQPTQTMRLLWISFLGEVFRRDHGGEWVFRGHGREGGVAVLCPTEDGTGRIVNVSGHVDRRLDEGISASLVYFFAMISIELRASRM